MSARKEVINVCSYFFEVLVKQFLELEGAIHKQSGLLSIFKKINYLDRANAFNGLIERAIEAKKSLPMVDEIKEEYELYSLAIKLTECLAIYVNLLESLVNLNIHLNRKANGEKYSINEYTMSLQHCDMLRSGLENELPKLQSLYAVVLKNGDDSNNIDCKEEINEKQLADTVLSEYLTDLERNFNDVLASLLKVGFGENDFEDKNWMKYDIFLCGLTIDGMALFNLLDSSQASSIFKYISVEKFMDLDDERQIDYSINRVSEYKHIWEKSLEESEPPFDFMFSKLYQDLLGEKIEKYEIGPLQMMQIISVVMPIFAGKWKKALERYKPIQDSRII